MGPVAIGFGLASGLTVWLSLGAFLSRPERFGDALGCSAMLFMTWALSNVLTALYKPPDAWLLYPVMDTICGAIVVALWLSKPQAWKGGLVLLFVLQCVLHVAFWLHREKPYGLLYAYTLALNVVFAAQLLTAGWPGGRYVVDRLGPVHRVSGGAGVAGPARPGRA